MTYVLYLLIDAGMSIYKEDYFNFYLHARTFLVFIILTTFVSTKDRYIFLYKLIVVALFVSTFFSICIYFFGEPFQSIRWWAVKGNSIGMPGGTFLGKGERIAGFTRSIHAFAYQIAPAVILSFALVLEYRKQVWKFVFGVLFFGMILNGERSAALTAMIGILGIMYYVHGANLKKITLLFVGFFALMVTSNYVISPNESVESFKEETLLHRMSKKNIVQDLQSRLLQQIGGLIVVANNPLFGGTASDYNKVMQKITKTNSSNIPAPHNHYINVAIKIGFVGYIIVIAFCFCIIKNVILFYRINKENKTFCYGTIFSLLALVITGLFHNSGLFYGEVTSWVVLSLVFGGNMLHDRLKTENMAL